MSETESGRMQLSNGDSMDENKPSETVEDDSQASEDTSAITELIRNWSVLRTAHLANAVALTYLVYTQHNSSRVLFDLYSAWEIVTEETAATKDVPGVTTSDIALMLGRAVNLQLMLFALVLYYGVFCHSDITRRWVSLLSMVSTFSTAKFLYTTVIAVAWVKGKGPGVVVSASQEIAKNLIMLTFFNFSAVAYDVFMTRLEGSSLKTKGLILFMKGDRLQKEEKRREVEATGESAKTDAMKKMD